MYIFTAENNALKSHFFMCKELLDFTDTAINYDSFKFVESFKRLFHQFGNCRFLICITLKATTASN